MTAISAEEVAKLLAHIEAATGPDREIDAALALALGGWHREWIEVGRNPHHKPDWFWWNDTDQPWRASNPERLPLFYTTSIDAALALVERMLPGCWWFFSKGKTRPTEPLFAFHIIPEGNTDGLTIGEAEAGTPPLAILAALLRALSQSGEQK